MFIYGNLGIIIGHIILPNIIVAMRRMNFCLVIFSIFCLCLKCKKRVNIYLLVYTLYLRGIFYPLSFISIYIL